MSKELNLLVRVTDNAIYLYRFFIPVSPKKNSLYFSCYFSKSVFYFIKIWKEICYTMLSVDLSICFISVPACIDFL